MQNAASEDPLLFISLVKASIFWRNQKWCCQTCKVHSHSRKLKGKAIMKLKLWLAVYLTNSLLYTDIFCILVA